MSRTLTASTQLERYRHISALGSGGMATVVLAEDTLLGRRVALKRMSSTGDTRGLSRLRREALIGASVSHPNLVSIYDVLTSDDGEHVIVMEYVPGETLRDALLSHARLAPPAALRILDGVAAALDAIHRQGIVHRDVKPANILLGADGTIKLADLGIASMADRTRITTDGALLGTFSYMAPEQLSGERATPASDVYALAAVAFQMLSGRKARTEPNPVALAHAISTRPPPDLRDAWPQAPAAAAEVLIRGMSRDPAGRPRSASELTRRLRAALEPQTTAPVSVRPARRRAMPATAVAAAAPVAAAAAAPAARAPTATPAARAAAAPQRQHGSGREGGSGAPKQVRLPPQPRRSHSALLPVGLLGLVLAAVVLAVLLNSGSSSHQTSGAASTNQPAAGTHHRSKRSSPRAAGSSAGATAASAGASAAGTSSSSRAATATAPSAPAAASTGSSSVSGTVPAAATASTPTSAVTSFYTLAAGHRYAAAWALADPSFRNQLGGYNSFAAGQAGDRSITFDTNRVVSMSANSATVAVRTTSVRYNGTQHCSGTVDLTRGGSSAAWLLHQIHINCA